MRSLATRTRRTLSATAAPSGHAQSVSFITHRARAVSTRRTRACRAAGALGRTRGAAQRSEHPHAQRTRRRSPALAFRCSIRRRSSASSASRARRPVPAVRHQPVQPRTCGLSCSASRAAPRCLRLPSRLRPVPAQPRLRHGRVAVVYAPAPPAPIVVYPGRRAGSNEGDSDHGQMRGTRITVK